MTRGVLWVVMGLTACGSPPVTPAPAIRTAEPSAPVAEPTPVSPPPGPVQKKVTAVQLMAHVEALCDEKLAGRRAYSPDEVAAADYLVAELEKAGIGPYGDVRRHGFAVGRHRSENVLGVVPCDGCDHADEYIVLGAHYDHMGKMADGLYLGAEDNASGVAVVLEIGRALMDRRSEIGRSVLLAFFGAEEVGLKGSRAMVRDEALAPERWRAMVNVDMIGRRTADREIFALPKSLAGIDDDDSVGALGAKGRPSFRQVVDAAFANEGLEVVAPEDLNPVLQRMVERIAAGRGDNFSFERIGVPAIFFSSGESDDYHRPSDTPDKLDPELMARRARSILETVVALSHLEAMPPATGP